MYVKFDYGKWDNFWGYQCSQCGAICPFIEGAIAHEQRTEENAGVCPQVEKRKFAKERVPSPLTT